MPTGKVNGSKFFGEERYQQYVDELTADGTLDGEQLSSEERKEGFKKRNDKIGFQEFVENVLERKKSADVSKSAGELPGEGKGGALVKASKSNLKEGTGITKLDPDKVVPPESAGGNVLGEILEIVTSIRDTLLEKEKRDKGRAKEEKQSAEREKRSKKEKGLESNIFKGLAKTTEKVLAPVKGLFEKIFDFIKTVLLGSIVVNILKWMGDPENKEKVDNLIKFLTDFFPAIAAAFILFGTKFGGLIRLLGGWAFQILRFAVPRLLTFITKNRKASAALVVAGGVGMLGARILTGTEIDGSEDEGSPPKEMSKGGVVPGSGNKDTVPAMLTPGEFVLSKGAVDKFGRGTLESMNAMGGGSGIPSFSDGIMFAKTGGHVPGSDEDKERPKFDPAAVSAMLSNRYGVDAEPIKTPTIQATEPLIPGKSKEQLSAEQANAELLSFISKGEGGYNSMNQGTSGGGIVGSTHNASSILGKNLPDMTVGEVMSHQASGRLFAAGRYQIIPSTMKLAVSNAGVSPDDMFDEKTQDKLGLALIYNGQRPTLSGYLQGKNDNLHGAMLDLALEWASAPHPDTGRSAYPPANKSSHTVDEVRAALSKAKQMGAGKFMSASPSASVSKGSRSSGSISSSNKSGKGTTPNNIKLSDMKAFDFTSMRQALGVKTGSISKSSRPSSSTMAYQQMLQEQPQGDGSGLTGPSAPNVPQFDAAAMSSNKKIKVLGITV